MQKIISTILFIFVSTTFIVSLFSISLMRHEGSMMIEPCAIANLGGSSECFFGKDKDIKAILEHISIISNSTLATLMDTAQFLIISTIVLGLFIVFFIKRKILFYKHEKDKPNKLRHNNKAYFPSRPRHIITWITQKIRGEINVLNLRTCMNML